MADKTLIEWSDFTLNFVVGCTKISDGCDNCYATREAWMQEKRWKSTKYTGLTILNNNELDWTGELRLIPELIELPLRKTKPLKIFVNSMSDLFHEQIFTFSNLQLLNAVDRFFHVMIKAEHHQYQILTKRPHIMRNFVLNFLKKNNMRELPKHIWLGTSVENQKVANTRIPKLLEIPGATKWLSCEPLLEEVDLTDVGPNGLNSLDGQYYTNGKHVLVGERGYTDKLDWVVVGGESGPNARPMLINWAEKIINDCKCFDVPVFFKQFGSKSAKIFGHKHKKGGDIDEFPEHLKVRQYPN